MKRARPRGLRRLLAAAISLAAARVSAAEGQVVVSEIHYHPRTPHGKAEFIELQNTGQAPVDLSRWRFLRGIEFTFPEGTVLAPGAFLALCQDLEAFRAAHGREAKAAGVYQGRLDNAGELVRLADAQGKAITDVLYLDSPPWAGGADGGGSSLARIRSDGDADDPSNWSAAAPSPGAPNPVQGKVPGPSLYQPRLFPDAPLPGKPVKVSIALANAPPGARVRLHYEVNGRESVLPMKQDPTAGRQGGDPVLSAVIPAQVRSTLVRYWFVGEGRGAAWRAPAQGAPTPNFAYHVTDLTASGKLPHYTLIMDPEALRGLEANPHSNQLWPATFIADGEVHDRVKVRHRGAWARSWPKKCWKVVFNRDHPFGKERRINLNSCFRDRAYIRETLAYGIFADAGSLSLSSEMVRLDLNGRFHGLFVRVEQPRERYLARNGLAGAVLFKAASTRNQSDERAFRSVEEFASHYTRETQPGATFEELWELCRDLAAAPDPVRFFEARVDVPRYVNYLCANAFTQNWDSFNKNHWLALDRRSGKWSVMPWDLDRTLGDHWDFEFDETSLPLYLGTERFPGTTGWNRLEERFLSVPAFRKRFEARMRELLDTVFTEEKLLPRVEGLVEAIAEAAELDRARWPYGAGWRQAVEEVRVFIGKRRAFLRGELAGNEPRTPVNVAPAAGTLANVFPVVLRSGPFAHDDRSISHHSTRWQVRAEGGSYLAPVVDETSERSLLALPLPQGVLFPRAGYRWRVAHIGSNGKASEFSGETAFSTGDFPMSTVRFDLSRHFNQDLVASPGARTEGSLDDMGGLLIEEGFDGSPRPNRLAQGLPHDRAVGIHLLGDYGERNAFQLTPDHGDPVRIAVPPGKYAFIRFVVAGAGDSTMPVALEYQDRGREERTIPCDDWYDDNPPDGPAGSFQPGSLPLLNGMDRLRGVFKDRNEPAIFEATIPADPGKVLRALVLDPGKAVYEKGPRGRFNLFAAAGVRLGPP